VITNRLQRQAGSQKTQQPGQHIKTLLAIVAGAIFSLWMAACGGSSAKPNAANTTPLISLTVTQFPPTSMLAGTTAEVAAAVTDDIANAGVDWIATCGSPANCGSFNPTHTASGSPTMYTAPTSVPSKGVVTLTALSTTDHSKFSSATASITSSVTGITITQAPTGTVPAGVTVTLGAVVTGDPGMAGVDWTATCTTAIGPINCGPAGLHSPAGGTVAFTVPGLVGNPLQTVTSVLITAFATADHSFSVTTSFNLTAAVSISLTQTPPSTLLTGGTATLVAKTANDSTNAGVTWIVSCSATPCGTVTPSQSVSGTAVTFTAPPTVPPGNPQVTITAYATAAGPQVNASANVTIFAPISIQLQEGVPTGSIVISASAPLIALLTNDAANAGVDWTVTCGSAGACGAFNPAHTASGSATTYTAPPAIPTGGTVTLTGASTTDPTQTVTQTVNVTAGLPPNNLMLGQFVMLVTAKNSSNGPFVIGGVLAGDGLGSITNGQFDLADSTGNLSAGVTVTSASTYSIGHDGRGQIQLQINTAVLNNPFGVNGTGGMTLSVVFITPQHALLSETDSFGTATGTLDLQNLQSLGGLNGVYSLKLSGVEAANAAAGYFVGSAIDILSANSYSVVTDQSDNGLITSIPNMTVASPFITGSFDGNGSMTLSHVNLGLPTQFSLDLWAIDATHIVVTDWRDAYLGTPPVIISGYLTAQPATPSISGNYVFTEAGATSAAQPQVAGGIFTCGASGTLDVTPLGGTALSNEAITANCAAPTNGRGTITISGATTGGVSQFAAYPTADQQLYLIELDGGASGTAGPSGGGLAVQQMITAPVDASALSGAYAANYIASTAQGSENFTAQIISDAVSALTGAADVNSFNVTAAPPVGTPSPGATLGGTYTASAAGRVAITLTITPGTGQATPPLTTLQLACYIVDANSCLALGTDPAAPGVGVLRLQNNGIE
jgi:hypothetical protein